MVETKVTFAFGLGEKVQTPSGDSGIISMLGYDELGIRYFVCSSANPNWFKERALKLAQVVG